MYKDVGNKKKNKHLKPFTVFLLYKTANMFLIIFPKCDILEVTNGMKCRVSDPDDDHLPEPDRYSALPVKVSDAECGVPDSIES